MEYLHFVAVCVAFVMLSLYALLFLCVAFAFFLVGQYRSFSFLVNSNRIRTVCVGVAKVTFNFILPNLF